MKSLAVPPQRQQGQKGHEKETQMKRHEEKPKNLRKEKNMKTTIVGWTKKKAFNGVIEGKQINRSSFSFCRKLITLTVTEKWSIR